MNSAHAPAIVTWIYAAGFGLSTLPVALYLKQNGRLPSFLGLFDMYGGPWSASLTHDSFAGRLLAFLAVELIVAWSGWLLWRGKSLGAVLKPRRPSGGSGLLVRLRTAHPWVTGLARVANPCQRLEVPPGHSHSETVGY